MVFRSFMFLMLLATQIHDTECASKVIGQPLMKGINRWSFSSRPTIMLYTVEELPVGTLVRISCYIQQNSPKDRYFGRFLIFEDERRAENNYTLVFSTSEVEFSQKVGVQNIFFTTNRYFIKPNSYLGFTYNATVLPIAFRSSLDDKGTLFLDAEDDALVVGKSYRAEPWLRQYYWAVEAEVELAEQGVTGNVGSTEKPGLVGNTTPTKGTGLREEEAGVHGENCRAAKSTFQLSNVITPECTTHCTVEPRIAQKRQDWIGCISEVIGQPLRRGLSRWSFSNPPSVMLYNAQILPVGTLARISCYIQQNSPDDLYFGRFLIFEKHAEYNYTLVYSTGEVEFNQREGIQNILFPKGEYFIKPNSYIGYTYNGTVLPIAFRASLDGNGTLFLGATVSSLEIGKTYRAQPWLRMYYWALEVEVELAEQGPAGCPRTETSTVSAAVTASSGK